jgi:hypothetical protein
MQSITTMVPTWQCGHTRNDSPGIEKRLARYPQLNRVAGTAMILFGLRVAVAAYNDAA